MIRTKAGIVHYVGVLKKIFIAYSAVMLLGIMFSLLFAFSGYLGFMILAPVLIVVHLAVYAFYALRITMGLALAVEVTPEVVHVKTKRRTYTYDAQKGCIAVKTYKNKFVCTFATQDSVDKFVFLRRAPFSKYYEEQFTAEEIAAFYPGYREEGAAVL